MCTIQNYVFVLLITCFTACTPLYVPNSRNAPMMSQQGEIQGQVTTGSDEMGIQGAYAISDDWVATGNFSATNKRNVEDQNYRKSTFASVGGGYYGKLGESGRFELLGEYGLAYTEAFQDDIGVIAGNIIRGNFNRAALQGDIGFVSKYAEALLSIRGSYVHALQLYDNSRQNINGFRNVLFAEPSVIVRAGIPEAKIFAEVGMALPMKDPVYEWSLMTFNVGLQVRLNHIYNKEG